MIYTRIKYFMIFIFFAIGVMLHLQFGLGSAWYLYVASFLLIITHFLFGTVGLAFARLKKGKLDEAEALLNQTKKPEWLSKKHKAYYHFTKGMIGMQQKDLETGKKHLSLALGGTLRNDKDRALVTLNLAHIAFVQKEKSDCKTLLEKAKSYKTNDLMIKEKIKELEEALSS